MNQISYILVHTGQHYDYEMSKVFFEDLELPEPEICLKVGSGTHAEQVAKVMVEFEKVLLAKKPDLVFVVGDVNSTLACALAASKIDYGETNSISNSCGRRPLIAHVEAGLRSFDRSMPEEINRLLTDAVSDYLFTPSADANENLKREGIPNDKIFLVGNVMADNLLLNLKHVKRSRILRRLHLQRELSTGDYQLITGYSLLTLHRPGSVDKRDVFLGLINVLTEIGKIIPIVFPVHPRTKKMIDKFKLQSYFVDLTNKELPITGSGIYLVNPLGYLDFLNLILHSRFVMTDSGGIQEETTILGIPCFTLRDTTERPVTITKGTNKLVNVKNLVSEIKIILDLCKSSRANSLFSEYNTKPKGVPEFWDGNAAMRIIDIIVNRAGLNHG